MWVILYLRINRPGSYVRFSSGARVEQLPGGMPDIKEFQVSGLIYLFIYLSNREGHFNFQDETFHQG